MVRCLVVVLRWQRQGGGLVPGLVGQVLPQSAAPVVDLPRYCPRAWRVLGLAAGLLWS